MCQRNLKGDAAVGGIIDLDLLLALI